ncbi:MAG: hypothetical protein ACYC1W_05970 [Gemmatimonadaceae bacterium]
MKLLALVATLLAHVGQNDDEGRCHYTKKVECSDRGACSSSAVGTAYLLMPPPESLIVRSAAAAQGRGTPPEIRRCDDRGCSPMVVWAVESGIFANIGTLNGGYYLKVAMAPSGEMKRGELVESATMFLASVNYWGRCTWR